MNAVSRALEDGNAGWLKRHWPVLFPHLPGPANDAEAAVQMHIARTAAESITLGKRLYSHAWLEERGLPSQLPEHLMPKKKVEPKIVSAVGVAIVSNKIGRAEAKDIEAAIAKAGGDATAAGASDEEVRRVMSDARRKAGLRSVA